MSQKQGFAAEKQACTYLVKQGLTLVEQNYRLKCGEIDLIMQDQSHLVFIEVRARTSSAYGGALASVSNQKQHKIIKAATLYLLKHKLHDKCPVRFDVVSLEGKPSQITWVKNAFETDF
tara:strand:+ start:2577 stop:2933 length:357 start_codon:yes stop_codon:yes gene_type:complete